MSWDAARIKVGTLPPVAAPPYAVRNELTIDGAGTPVSAVHPRWDAAGNLLWLSDRSGYWNFQTWRGGGVLQICGGTKAPTREPLHDHRYDFTEPAWQLGPGSYVPLADGRILCTWFEEGVQVIGILADGEVTRLTSQVVSVRGGVAANGRSAAVVVGFLDRPVALCRLDLVTGHLSEVRTSVDEYLDRRTLAVPEALRVGENQVRAWFYPPDQPRVRRAGRGELPPLRVLTHGGPTGMADCALDLSIQFWTSRGYGVADVNYRGSSGFGRDYRRQLAGQWGGIVDVADVLAVAEHLVQTGRVDGRRLVIEGGSAGGYTTLRALTTSDLFRAGISRYGIGDLETLARDTHKFESRYLDGLIGRYPEDRAFYVERSPDPSPGPTPLRDADPAGHRGPGGATQPGRGHGRRRAGPGTAGRAAAVRGRGGARLPTLRLGRPRPGGRGVLLCPGARPSARRSRTAPAGGEPDAVTPPPGTPPRQRTRRRPGWSLDALGLVGGANN